MPDFIFGLAAKEYLPERSDDCLESYIMDKGRCCSYTLILFVYDIANGHIFI